MRINRMEVALCEYRAVLCRYLPDLQQLPPDLSQLVLEFVMDECIDLIVTGIFKIPIWRTGEQIEQWWMRYASTPQNAMIAIGINIATSAITARMFFFYIRDSLAFFHLMRTNTFSQALWDSDEGYLKKSTIPRSRIDQMAEEITAAFFAKMREATVRLA